MRTSFAWRRSALATVVGLSLLSGAAWAQTPPSPPPADAMPGPGWHGHGEHGEPAAAPWLEGIALTPDQQAKIEALRKADRPTLRADMQAAFQSRSDLEALIRSGRFTDAQARQIVQAGLSAQVDLEVARAHREADIWALLTPEQRAQIQARRERAMPMHGGPMGPQ